MKKTVIFVLVGLLAFGLLGPASAKKKKPKAPAPVEVQYFLHTDESCEALSLTLRDGEDATDCFFGVDDMLNEYPQTYAVIGDPVDRYAATEGVPLKLDASRKAVGTVTLRGFGNSTAGLGVGSAKVDITLSATIAGEEKEIGTFKHSYTAGPNHLEKVDFEFEIDPALNGVVAEGLTLAVFTHGNVVFGRGIEHDAEVPPTITIPAFK